MVSRSFVVLFASVACWGQTPNPASPLAFRQDSTLPHPPAQSNTNLTPEMRGDIQMARKMYREAIDTYASGGLNSAVLVNKIGIAYHQLLDVLAWR